MDTYVYIAGAATVVAVALAAYFMSSSSPRKVLNKDEFKEFPLIEKSVISHNSARYRFGLPRPTDILGLPIGQHISIAANIDGKEIVRSYTPTSSDEDKGFFDLVIKTYPTGNISKHVGNLAIGDTINVRGPKGNFVYTPGMVRAFGMVAGGTGITPMYQIIRAIATNPQDKTEVHLVFANVNPEDILLKAELEEMAAKRDNIHIYYVLNNPPTGWTGGVGFVTADILKQKCPAPANDVKLLICGPPPMVSAVKKAAVDLGFTKAKPVSKLEDQVFAF
uniref:NADH-cytochrome b5 reductase n=1 Tax=Blastobotrys adeninivorans TaxID=409370 RepID=A0A060T2E0_BLAAD